MRKASVITQIFFGSALVLPFMNATVIETSRYRDVENYLTSTTLVVSDLDNTLIRPLSYLGSDEWGAGRGKGYVDQSYPKEIAAERGVWEFATAQFFVSVKPVEKDTPDFLAALAEKGVPIVGLTARPLVLVDRTLAELASVNIKFPTSALRDQLDVGISHAGVVIKGGVVFVGALNDKGTVFKELFQKNNLHYDQIVFIDDKLHNVQSVETAFANTGIKFIGLRYGFTDEVVKAFDPVLGEIEWNTLLNEKRVMTDEEATKLKNSPPTPAR